MNSELAFPAQVLPAEAFGQDDDFAGAAFLLFDGKRGIWTHGRDKVEAPKGTKAIALIDQMLKGFVRYDDGVPRSRLVPIWPIPDMHALRQTLGDLDPDLWPDRNAKNEPQDPWRPSRKLPILLVESCEGVIFSTSSFGGIKAISHLGSAVRSMRHDPQNAGAVPIVSLNAESYAHPNKTFGRIYSPLLDIEDWTTLGEVEEMMRAGSFNKILSPPASEGGGDPDADRSTAAARERLQKMRDHVEKRRNR
jgi:hypothetical protein